jgi:prepilin-type N-terminal cleavage/methylation domain-containing protein
MRLIKSQQGETIIEVLLAMSVLAMVLAVAYATTNRNFRAVQDAQERTEASQIAQNINEIINVYAYDPTLSAMLEPPNPGGAIFYRCINPDLTETNPNNKIQSTNAAGSDTFCSAWDNKGLFNAVVQVRRKLPAPGPGVEKFDYAVIVTWKSLQSGADSQAIIRQSVVKEP